MGCSGVFVKGGGEVQRKIYVIVGGNSSGGCVRVYWRKKFDRSNEPFCKKYCIESSFVYLAVTQQYFLFASVVNFSIFLAKFSITYGFYFL